MGDAIFHACAAQVAREKGRMPQDGFTQRVVPLFETLADLRSAGASLRRLLSVPWYRRLLQCVSGTLSKPIECSLEGVIVLTST